MENTIEKKKRENKSEDRKALKKFTIIMLGCFFGGVAAGFAGAMLGEAWSHWAGGGVSKFLGFTGIYGGIVVQMILGAVAVVLYRKAKKEAACWDGEDDEFYAKIDAKLALIMYLSQCMGIASYLFFGFGVYCTMQDRGTMFSDYMKANHEIWLASLLVVFVTLFAAMVAFSLIQQKAVNLLKELNPEKKGSVYDTKFNRTWLESCDEAEKARIYESSHRSMKATAHTCIVLWVVSLMGMYCFDFGIAPMIMVLIIWFVQTSSYCLSAIKLEKNK